MSVSKQRLRGSLAALAVLACAGAALGDFIVESRTGGQNFNKYSETGVWNNSSGKSTASGVTPGIGSRYGSTYRSVAGEKHAIFKGNINVAGTYEVFTTWGVAQNRRSPIRYTVTHKNGTTDVNVNQAATANAWVSLGQYQYNSGIDVAQVDMNNLSLDVSGSMYADAVKWVLISSDCNANLPRPSITAPSPLKSTDTSITVSGVDANATALNIYDVSGGTTTVIATIPQAELTPPTQVVTVDLSAMAGGGHVIAAGQIIGGEESCVDISLGKEVDACSQVPAVTLAGVYIPPDNTVLSQIYVSGDNKVRVTGVSPEATLVTVYANGSPIGTKVPGGATAVDVDVTPLASNAVISATQSLRDLPGCVPTTGPRVDDCSRVAGVRVVGLVSAGSNTVRVTGISPDATEIKVYATGDNVLIGTKSTDGTSESVTVTLDPQVRPNGLVLGQVIKATQMIRGIHGCIPGTGVTVKAEGIIEDFEGTVTVANHPSPGAFNVWYDIADNAYTHVWLSGASGAGVLPPGQSVPQLNGSRCISILDPGWTNGAYVKFEEIIPPPDPNPEIGNKYHLQIDMLVDERGVDPDFYKTYQVGVVVNGAHRASNGALPAISSPLGNYPKDKLTSTQDGYLSASTPAVQVLTQTFTANEGDDLLIAFANNMSSHDAGKTAGIGTPVEGLYVGMLVDNIKLVRGPRPCLPEDVGAVTVITAGPLEEGATQVIIDKVAASASKVRLYEYDPAKEPPHTLLHEELAPGGGFVSQVPITLSTPLVAGQMLVATQFDMVCDPPQEMESIKATSGPVVGSGAPAPGRNTPIMMSLGIREGTSGTVIGENGTAPSGAAIEWIGSTTAGGAPQGKPITPSPYWQTITFDPATDPIRSFNAGNGVLDGNYGVLDALGLTIAGPPYNSGRYVLYIDNVTSTDAATETPVVFANFDDDTGDEALFRRPSFSGTTCSATGDNFLLWDGTLTATTPPAPDPAHVFPNVSTVDDTVFDGASGKSLRIEFQFNGNSPNHWLRLVTANAPAHPNPVVDLRRPITLRVLLMACNAPFADADGDKDVDQDDFGVFQSCFTGPGGTISGAVCGCMNVKTWNGSSYAEKDSDVDDGDLMEFIKCITGPELDYVADDPKVPGASCEGWQ